jgi:hypothetical protein
MDRKRFIPRSPLFYAITVLGFLQGSLYIFIYREQVSWLGIDGLYKSFGRLLDVVSPRSSSVYLAWLVVYAFFVCAAWYYVRFIDTEAQAYDVMPAREPRAFAGLLVVPWCVAVAWVCFMAMVSAITPGEPSSVICAVFDAFAQLTEGYSSYTPQTWGKVLLLLTASAYAEELFFRSFLRRHLECSGWHRDIQMCIGSAAYALCFLPLGVFPTAMAFAFGCVMWILFSVTKDALLNALVRVAINMSVALMSAGLFGQRLRLWAHDECALSVPGPLGHWYTSAFMLVPVVVVIAVGAVMLQSKGLEKGGRLKRFLNWAGTVFAAGALAAIPLVLLIHFSLTEPVILRWFYKDVTAYAERYAEPYFNKVQEGMTKGDVERVLGEPLTKGVNRISAVETEFWRYTEQTEGMGVWFLRVVVFDSSGTVRKRHKSAVLCRTVTGDKR